MIKINHFIGTTIEGNLGEIVIAKTPEIPTLAQLVAATKNLCFIVECVAHLQGKEEEMLPYAVHARELVAKLEREGQNLQ